eukprot:82460_1
MSYSRLARVGVRYLLLEKEDDYRTCILIYASKENPIRFGFSLMNAQYNAYLDMSLRITGPGEELIHCRRFAELADIDYVTASVKNVGEYTICFQSTSFKTVLVTFGSKVQEQEAKEIASIGNYVAEECNNHVRTAIDAVGMIERLQVKIRVQNYMDFMQFQSLANALDYVAMLSCAMLVGLSSFQVFMIKSWVVESIDRRDHLHV